VTRPEDTQPVWGGRYAARLDPAIHAFTNSLPFDRRLVRQDLLGSLAHVRMLLETGVLTPEDAGAVLDGLSELLRDVETGELSVEGPDEDVHGWIERTLVERLGEPGRRVHTARSRNDQTAVALRLWVREAAAELVGAVLGLAGTWTEQAERHLESWMPGYTHLQRAQPVTLAHHLMAHAFALLADGERFRSVREAAGVSPLGAGALAGTSHPIAPERTARLLGLERIYPNTQLAVADRDYVAEAVFAAALLMTHLSRWAEEVVLWTSSEFRFAALSDRVAQGSSLMPQKKNPEAAELIRGKSGRAVGDLVTLLTVLKGLPLAYDSDLQEDKEPLFDAMDTALGSLRAAAALAAGIEYRPERLAAALRGGFLTATDLADHLTRLGVPFRTAHAQAGAAVRAAEQRGVELAELPLEVLREACPKVDEGVGAELAPEAAARARRSPGGPAPERVAEQVAEARERMSDLHRWLEELEEPPILRAHREGRLRDEALP
jgi:argininosuccinate lyase